MNRSVVHKAGDTHTIVASSYADVTQNQRVPKEKEVRKSTNERSREATSSKSNQIKKFIDKSLQTRTNKNKYM